ncbi:mitochondrial ribonuclease P protein 1-like [Acanthaster planci]|uniref:RNA (guanine-9-)-methyltransferase domain-containing protein 1 n=1 Tax=Acanthaster planci TaxID=133434 RepID=A0A8B7Z073_ACAPL|nr:mitochondrial ribonuclease P protein 1-like [Acanthaster planci]
MQHLRTPMQALRRAQADVICRSRRKVKPSSELLQVLPDLYEIFNETQPHRAGQRRGKKLHWALLPHRLSFLNRSPVGNLKDVGISARYSTRAAVLQDVSVPDGLLLNTTHRVRLEKASTLNLCEISKLHQSLCVAKSHQNESLNARFSLEEILTSLQSNPAVVPVKRMGPVQGLLDEIQWRKLRGKPNPESINGLDLHHLLNLQSQTSRKKFLNFLLKKEKHKLKKTKKKESRMKLKAQEAATLQQPDLTVKNALVRQGQSIAENTANTWNLARGLMFGPPIVFDLSYDHHMDRRELINAVMQLNLVLKTNKTMRDPFHVHFTNVAHDGHTEQELKRVHGEHLDNLMVSITEQPPQHVFVSEELVYLTADSPNVLTGYNPNKVYIIGGFVDRCVKSRVSLRKAEEAGIVHARLPLDDHLQWHKSTKNLTLDQMMAILSELRESQDWRKALQHVPSRKHLGIKIHASPA